MKNRNNPLAHLRAAMSEPLSFSAFLSSLGEKDRKSISRHLALYEQKLGAPAAQRWTRLACVLMTLAPRGAKILAQQAVQYYVPDGMYRKQVFALQPSGDGELMLYATNVLDQAIRQGILGQPREHDGVTLYPIKGTDDTLEIGLLDGHTADPAPIFKAMTGWNRKAISIRLPADASNVQVEAAEMLCALSAVEWSSNSSTPQTAPGRAIA